MERYTNQQVIEQKERFDCFMSNVNLIKLGERIVHFINNEKDSYNRYNFIRRVLKFNANVERSMLYPNTNNKYYGDILIQKSMIAYCDNLDKITKESM